MTGFLLTKIALNSGKRTLSYPVFFLSRTVMEPPGPLVAVVHCLARSGTVCASLSVSRKSFPRFEGRRLVFPASSFRQGMDGISGSCLAKAERRKWRKSRKIQKEKEPGSQPRISLPGERATYPESRAGVKDGLFPAFIRGDRAGKDFREVACRPAENGRAGFFPEDGNGRPVMRFFRFRRAGAGACGSAGFCDRMPAEIKSNINTLRFVTNY